MSTSILEGEYARILEENIAELSKRKLVTLLIDGWEDLSHRSLYGTVAAGVEQYPIILSLDELTGQRGNAEKILETAVGAITKSEIPLRHILAIVTDNPSVMRSMRKKFIEKYPWALVS